MVESTFNDAYPSSQAFLEEVLDDLVQRFIVNIPPEDFQSFERLFFHIEEAHWFYEDFWREESKNRGFILSSLSFTEFAELIFHHCPFLAPFKHSVQQHAKSFASYKSQVPVYGAALFNASLDKLVLVKGFTSKAWNFPRGKISKNENDAACAVREVKEEIGFDISSYLDAQKFIKVGNVKLFIVTGVPDDTVFSTQTRKEISEIRWHSLSTLKNNMNLKPFTLIRNHLNQLFAWVKHLPRPQQVPTPAATVQYPASSPSKPIVNKNRKTFSPDKKQPSPHQNGKGQKNFYGGPRKLNNSPPRSSAFQTPSNPPQAKPFSGPQPSSFNFSFNADEILA